MKYYRCKCGKSEAWGSMPPWSCSYCPKCGSNLALGPDGHREPEPHKWTTEAVETDAGPQPLTRCFWCGKKPREIIDEAVERTKALRERELAGEQISAELLALILRTSRDAEHATERAAPTPSEEKR